MNSPERVMAAIAGKPHDRPPFGLVLSLYGAQLIDSRLEDYFRDPDAYTRAQERILDLFHPDILFGPFALALLGEAWGSQLKFQKEQAPNVKRPAAKTVSEFLALPEPDIEGHPSLKFLRESVRGVVRKTQGRAVVAMPMMSPIDLPALILGLETWIELFLLHPHDVDAVYERTSRFTAKWCQAIMSEGVGCLVMPAPMLSCSLLPLHMIESRSLPLYREFFSTNSFPTLIHHGGERLLPSLLLAARLPPSVIGFAADARDSLGEVRSLVGPNRVVIGGIEGPQLHAQREDALREQTRLILTDRQDDPHFIFCTTGADVSVHASVDQIRAIADTIEHFRHE
ncbi:MAG TPA: uroporphyrinogen decarboxylase family protein [Candidatus Ozemobacteraceae bacterium]|nr:uroporphyrinogen decarboxylase family protein [Candidatus Ozemobacteraceae bacterium]